MGMSIYISKESGLLVGGTPAMMGVVSLLSEEFMKVNALAHESAFELEDYGDVYLGDLTDSEFKELLLAAENAHQRFLAIVDSSSNPRNLDGTSVKWDELFRMLKADPKYK